MTKLFLCKFLPGNRDSNVGLESILDITMLITVDRHSNYGCPENRLFSIIIVCVSLPVTDRLLVAPCPTVGDEHLDLGVGEEGGLGEPGREQDIVRSVRHISLPLPDDLLMVSLSVAVYTHVQHLGISYQVLGLSNRSQVIYTYVSSKNITDMSEVMDRGTVRIQHIFCHLAGEGRELGLDHDVGDPRRYF